MKTGSASEVNKRFEEVSSTGQSVLDDLEQVRLSELIAFEQRISESNLRRCRVERLCASGVLGHFTVADMNAVHLQNTTATVRADVMAASLKEKGDFVSADIQEIQFSANVGSYQRLSNTYKVISTEGIPIGRFDIVLLRPVTMNQVVFDLVAPSPDLQVKVSVISADLKETETLSVARNGYRFSCWMPERQLRYLRIEMKPGGPDTAGGIGYTFGITDLQIIRQNYHLASELVMKPVSVPARSKKAVFRTESESGLSYFLSFDGLNFAEVVPDAVVNLPVTYVEQTGVTVNSSGLLSHTLNAAVNTASLKVTSSGQNVPVVHNLKTGHTPAVKSVVQRGLTLKYLPMAEADESKTFTVGYFLLPAEIQVWMKVRFVSNDNSVTPVFKGAYLEESE